MLEHADCLGARAHTATRSIPNFNIFTYSSVEVSPYRHFQNVLCIVSSLSGAGLEYQTKTEGVQCGKKNYFRANQLLIPSSTHPSCEYEQLRADYIHLNSICWPVEWSAMGPRLGWGSVEGGARSAKWKPPPTGLLWVRVCTAEWKAHGRTHKMKCQTGQRGSTECRGKKFNKACSLDKYDCKDPAGE